MSNIKNIGAELINQKKSSKITQWKGKTREEKRHQAMLNMIKKWQEGDKTYF